MSAHPFLHDLPAGCCRFVLGCAPRRVLATGPAYRLAVACGAPAVDARGQPGGSWCPAHRAVVYDATPRPSSVRADTRTLRRPPVADVTPDLCEEISR